MSVSVTKSGFNVREKLKQLQKPIGLKGSELMRAETAQEAGSYLGVGRRNLCINGNFKIWQRGTSIAGGASGNTANGYKYVTADRWQTYFYNTYARQDTVLPNGERVYSFRETFNTTRLYFDQVIEDGGRIFNQGDYITVSFWAKTSGPSTGVSVGFYWYTGPNFAGGTYTYSNLRKNVIIEGSEWKYYTVTALLPTNADNRPHLAVEFDNYSPYGPLFGGSWSQLDGTDYWEFANIQIEKGKVATEFEHRSYGEELALCQRYCQRLGPDDGTTTTHYNSIASGWLRSGSIVAYALQTQTDLPVRMRTIPTASVGGGTNTFYAQYGSTGITCSFSNLNIQGSSPQKVWLDFQPSSTAGTDGLRAIVGSDNSSGGTGQTNYIILSAEL